MVYRKIWKDPWFRKLDCYGRTLWLYLLTPGENISRCGLIESDLELVRFESCLLELDTGKVDALLESFREAGKIYREGDCILIKNFMAYQCYNTNSMASARADLEEWRERCPSLVDEAETILTMLEQAKDAPKKALTEAQEEVLPLTERLIALIHDSCAATGKREPQNELHKCAALVEQVLRMEKIPGEDVEKVLIWALQDDFWRDVILAIPYWRKVSKQNGRAKFANAWSSWRQATGQTATRTGKKAGGSDWSTE